MAIPTYVRLRPSNCMVPSIEISGNNHLLLRKNTKESHKFRFDKVLGPNVTQGDVYQQCAHSLVCNVLNGHDSSIFTVGASGSGKTFSTLGTEQDSGVLFQAVDEIFQKVVSSGAGIAGADYDTGLNFLCDFYGTSIQKSKKWASQQGAPQSGTPHQPKTCSAAQYFVTINVFELYSNTVFDLLRNGAECKKIISDPRDGKIQPNDIVHQHVVDLSEARESISRALHMRHVGSTEMNSESSRSHFFVYVNVHQVEMDQCAINSSRLTVADLAGSERLSGLGDRQQQQQQRESNFTNLTLSELGRALQSISEIRAPIKESDKSILRSTKLNRLLFADYLGNKNHRMNILMTVDPAKDPSITFSVLSIIKSAECVSNHSSPGKKASLSPLKRPMSISKNSSKSPSKSPAKGSRASLVKLLNAKMAAKSSEFGSGNSSTVLSVAQSKLAKSPTRVGVRTSIDKLSQMTRDSQARINKVNNLNNMNIQDFMCSSPNFSQQSDLSMSSNESPNKFSGSNFVSPIKPSEQNKLTREMDHLERENMEMRRQIEVLHETLSQKEVMIKQETAMEYSKIIENIERNHLELLAKLEQKNVESTDEKMEYLARELQEEISKLRQDNTDLLNENSKLLTDYEQLMYKSEKDGNNLRDLELQINNFNNENIKLRHENEKLKKESSRAKKIQQSLAAEKEKNNLLLARLNRFENLTSVSMEHKTKMVLRDSLGNANKKNMKPLKKSCLVMYGENEESF